MYAATAPASRKSTATSNHGLIEDFGGSGGGVAGRAGRGFAAELCGGCFSGGVEILLPTGTALCGNAIVSRDVVAGTGTDLEAPIGTALSGMAIVCRGIIEGCEIVSGGGMGTASGSGILTGAGAAESLGTGAASNANPTRSTD